MAPVLLIAGNHDMNEANANRLDALSPICKNLAHPSLHYLKYSGVYRVADVDFAVLSIVGDKADWPTPADCTAKTKIALFHGPVHNARTDVGYTITERHVTVELFEGFDLALLGDIHRHQVLDLGQDDEIEVNESKVRLCRKKQKPLIAYASSLIQQNHGESIKGHGWLDWNIPARTFTFNELVNQYGYYTLTIENGVVPSTDDMPKNVRLRINAGDLDPSEIKKVVTMLRTKHNITELAVNTFGKGTLSSRSAQVTNFLDIQDVDYQNKLILEYLADVRPNLDQDDLEAVVKINREMNEQVKKDDTNRRLVWTPISLKFDNLFTYGKGNFIDFTNMKGVMGLFSPNATGKSSIPDAICFALYDRTPRTTKGVNIMNTREKECSLEFQFEIDGKRYVIERRGKKNKNGEVKIDVDFKLIDPTAKDGFVSLNGEQRVYTNKVIASYVGEYEDFILTAFSAQTQNGLFIDRGQSERKDTLSQFMGLTIFDKLHTLANEKSKEVSAELKKFHADDFTQLLADTQLEMKTLLENRKTIDEEIERIESIIEQYTKEIQDEYERKTPISLKTTNVGMLESTKARLEGQVSSVETEIAEKAEKLADLSDKLERGKKKLADKFAGIEEKFAEIPKLEREKSVVSATVTSTLKELSRNKNTLESFAVLDFDPNCSFCVSVNKRTVEQIENTKRYIAENNAQYETAKARLEELDARLLELQDVAELHQKFVEAKEWIAKTEREVGQLEVTVARLETTREQTIRKVEETSRDIEDYYRLEDAITKNAEIDQQIARLETFKRTSQTELSTKQSHRRVNLTDYAKKETVRDDMLARIKKAEALESQVEVYEAYLAAVCRDGLPYKLISEVLPQVQIEVNRILSQMVEFSVVLEVDGKNVNGKIVYDEHRSWPIELASGMEKFVTGLAIRVALMSVSSLPKTNFLIIDEGLGALDADNLSSLFMLFDVLRAQFDFILLISHLDVVRDVSDNLIEIKRDDGYSQVLYS
jgi:DNA repair exonuclease SbcCD ATPase subunit